ncbi:hypothetical protein [Phytobacter diazotrophicus]|uniref:hypothetical protein n=1 Tax=Phytobacter diazotrophicus TaxID=395631 RepID=UPI003075EE6E
MKQVTMESVKQRIADLESAGKVVGGLSLSSEFELACLRELVALTEQRDALIAENATLREAAEFAIAPDMWEELGGNVLRYQYQEWYADKLKAALSSPATDAARASLRAEGVDMFAAQERAIAARRKSNGVDDCFIKKILETAENAEEFAKELRESKGEVSNG